MHVGEQNISENQDELMGNKEKEFVHGSEPPLKSGRIESAQDFWAGNVAQTVGSAGSALPLRLAVCVGGTMLALIRAI